MKLKKTKKEILAQLAIFVANIWSNPKRFSIQPQVDECEHCGRKVGKNPLFVHIETSGNIVPNGINEEDLERVDKQSQGCFPIGNGCAKKLFGDKIELYTFRYD